MTKRSKARQVALQTLYSMDVNPELNVSMARELMTEQLSSADLFDFAWDLFSGTLEYKPLLDEKIEAVAENWTISPHGSYRSKCTKAGTFRNALQGDSQSGCA